MYFTLHSDSSKISPNWLLKNTNVCHFKTTGQKWFIFEYVNLEVYGVDLPRVEWAGPTHLGHIPTLQIGLLQYKKGQPVWLLSHTVIANTNFWKRKCCLWWDIVSYLIMQYSWILNKMISSISTIVYWFSIFSIICFSCKQF